MTWYLMDLPFMCLGAAVFELDAVYVGQWMVSRPIVLGPLIGLVCGDVGLGIKIGVLIELLVIKDVAVGNVLPLNGALAAAIIVLLSGGAGHVEPAAAFPAGVALGSFHRRAERRIRMWRGGLNFLAEEALDRDKKIPFSKLLTLSLAGHAFFSAIFIFVSVAALSPLLSWGWTAVPEAVRLGLRWAFEAVPWLGLAGLMHAFWR